MNRCLPLLCLIAVLCGCSRNVRRVDTFSLDRPGRAALVCFETSGNSPVSLDNCAPSGATESGSGLGFALHLFVVQERRGEVAVIDWKNGNLIDIDKTVPGFTFTPVGETPIDILVPSINADKTYVLNRGSQDLWVMPTSVLKSGVTEGVLPLQRVDLGATPYAMTLGRDEQEIWITLPDEAALMRLPIAEDGLLGAPERRPLGASIPEAIAPDNVVPLQKSCPPTVTLDTPTLSNTRAVITDGDQPGPSGIAYDPETRTIWVADLSLPILHRLEPDVGDSEKQINVKSPTRELRVTPSVPFDLSGNGSTRKFVYAIDAVDSSLMVIDATNGAVLPVDAQGGRPSDRIALGASVQTLQVLTPDLSGVQCVPGSTEASSATASQLRGVFVAAGMTDGTLRLIDVFDLDLACRGAAEACANPGTTVSNYVLFQQHRPRIGNINDPDVITTIVTGTPVFASSNGNVPIQDSGETTLAGIPDLIALTAGCPTGFQKGFPRQNATSAPLICVRQSPWDSTPDRWVAGYEAAIPGTRDGAGVLDPASGLLTGAIAYCDQGVLGQSSLQGLSDDTPEAGYIGDQVRFIGKLPSAASSECRTKFPTDLLEDRVSVGFAILDASRESLHLAGSALNLPNVTLADVSECFAGYLLYEVRSQRVLTVVGDRAGFTHRTITDDAGRCQIDVSRDVRLQGRAQPGKLFTGALVAFQVQPFDEAIDQSLDIRSALTFTTASGAPQLAADTGSLPSAFAYRSGDNRLFVVDVGQRQVRQFSLTDFNANTSTIR